jgi:UDP-hydrolysing UDP-N-acetyl-D-glucosamine 2-epimerase
MLACRRRGAAVIPVLYASALDERFGDVRASLLADGWDQVRGLHCHTQDGMAATTGTALVEWQAVLPWLNADAVVVVGDRHEQLAPAIAAAYAGVRLVHTMGGETSGNIDDKVRDAITALADVHCVATDGALDRVMEIMRPIGICRRGHAEVTGCPRIDTVKEALEGETRRAFLPMLMVSQHPVTDRTARENHDDMAATLEAVTAVAERHGFGVELFWPNADAGAYGTHSAIREWLAGPGERLTVRTHRTMGPTEYARMMAATKCLVGNSSSGIREGAWIGTPVVQVGGRQRGREMAGNVQTCGGVYANLAEFSNAIALSIGSQVHRGPRECSTLYGDGTAGERVARVVIGCP